MKLELWRSQEPRRKKTTFGLSKDTEVFFLLQMKATLTQEESDACDKYGVSEWPIHQWVTQHSSAPESHSLSLPDLRQEEGYRTEDADANALRIIEGTVVKQLESLVSYLQSAQHYEGYQAIDLSLPGAQVQDGSSPSATPTEGE